MNPGRLRSVSSASEFPINRVLYRWMDRVGVRSWSFVNSQQSRGKFKPSSEDTSFLTEVIRSHDGVIVVLGAENARLFSRFGVEFFPAPHPSGLNRRLNDKKYVDKMLEDMEMFINRSRVGDE